MKYAILLLMMAFQVNAASFDCRKAATDIELMICSSEDLSMADAVLSTVYQERVKSNPALRNEQRKWIREVRNQATPDKMLSVYRSRIHDLSGYSISTTSDTNVSVVVDEPVKPERVVRAKEPPTEQRRYNPSYTKEDLIVAIQAIALIDYCYGVGYPETADSIKSKSDLLEEAKTYQYYDKGLAGQIYDEKLSMFRTLSRHDSYAVCQQVYSGMRGDNMQEKAHSQF